MRQPSRHITPMLLFVFSLNGIIGSGWLFAPFYTVKIAGPAALLSWVIGGVAAIVIAFTFAELSTLLPVAGGAAHVPHLSHGLFTSFVLSWITWLTSFVMVPIEVQAVLQYASLYFPSLTHYYTHGVAALTLTGYIWAALIMMLLCVLNSINYQVLMRFNLIITIFKFFVLFLAIYMIFHARFNPANLNGFTESMTTASGWKAIFSAVATGGVVMAFNGFKNGVELAGETKNLSVAIPLSTIGSVFVCCILYMGLQLCFIGALDPASIKHGWHHLNYHGDVGPLVGLAGLLGLVMLVKLLYVNSIVSPAGTGLSYVTSSARILYAMSKIGFVPKFLAHLNRQHFPIRAIIANFCLGMLVFLPLSGWQAMVNFLVSAMVISYAMGPIALLSLRKSIPTKERPFHLRAAPFVCLIAFYFCNLFSIWTGWETISKLSIVLVAGMIIFLTSVLRGSVKLKKQDWRAACWVLPYLFGLGFISYLSSFGGTNFIPFGWDFIVIGIFTIVILYLAVHNRADLTSEEVSEYLFAESAVIS